MFGTVDTAAALAATIQQATSGCRAAPADPLRHAAEQSRDQVLALAAQMDREGRPRTAWEVRRAMEPLIDALEGGAS